MTSIFKRDRLGTGRLHERMEIAVGTMAAGADAGTSAGAGGCNGLRSQKGPTDRKRRKGKEGGVAQIRSRA